jgi:histidine triad (HIT) family protein
MSDLSPEQKAALEQQKAQCPFCKIVKGEIPSKKTFEDEKILAVLDINPLIDGHTLFMPKEHYPIMPLIPADEFIHLFKTAREFMICTKKGLARTGVTMFIANGYAAGQMAAHFLFHIIPREEGDGIYNFELEGKEPVNPEEFDKVYNLVKNNLPIMMNNHFKRQPADWHDSNASGGSGAQKFTKDQAIGIIEQNPQLKDFIMQAPVEFMKQAKEHDQLKQLFADVDVVEVIRHYKPDFIPPPESQKGSETKGAEDSSEAGSGTDSAGSESPIPVANDALSAAAALAGGALLQQQSEEAGYSKEEVVSLVMKSDKIKNMLVNDTEAFLKALEHNEKLKEIFKGIDPHEIIEAIKASDLEKTEGQDKNDSYEEHDDAKDPESGDDSPTIGTTDDKSPIKEAKYVEIPKENPQEDQEIVSEEMVSEKFEKAISLIKNSPKMQVLIESDPDTFRKLAQENEKLKQVFSDISIDEVISHFKIQESSIESEPETPLEHAIELVNHSTKVKELIEKDPDEFRRNLETNDKLKALFQGIDIDALIAHFHKENSSVDSVDSDDSDDSVDSVDSDDVLDLLGGK